MANQLPQIPQSPEPSATSENLPTPFNTNRITPDNEGIGNQIGQGMQEAAKPVVTYAQQRQAIEEKAKNDAQATEVLQGDADAQVALKQTTDKFKTLVGTDAHDAYEKTLTDYDQTLTKIKASMSPEAADAFSKAREPLLTKDLLVATNDHLAQQNQAMKANAAKANAAASTDSVADAAASIATAPGTDMTKTDALIGRRLQMVALEWHGNPPEVVNEQVALERKRLVGVALSQLIGAAKGDDPAGSREALTKAQAYLDAHRDDLGDRQARDALDVIKATKSSATNFLLARQALTGNIDPAAGQAAPASAQPQMYMGRKISYSADGRQGYLEEVPGDQGGYPKGGKTTAPDAPAAKQSAPAANTGLIDPVTGQVDQNKLLALVESSQDKGFVEEVLRQASVHDKLIQGANQQGLASLAAFGASQPTGRLDANGKPVLDANGQPERAEAPFSLARIRADGNASTLLNQLTQREPKSAEALEALDNREMRIEAANANLASREQKQAITEASTDALRKAMVDVGTNSRQYRADGVTEDAYRTRLINGEFGPMTVKDIQQAVAVFRQDQKGAPGKPTATQAIAAMNFAGLKSRDQHAQYQQILLEAADKWAQDEARKPNAKPLTDQDFRAFFDKELKNVKVKGAGWFGSDTTERRINAEIKTQAGGDYEGKTLEDIDEAPKTLVDQHLDAHPGSQASANTQTTAPAYSGSMTEEQLADANEQAKYKAAQRDYEKKLADYKTQALANAAKRKVRDVESAIGLGKVADFRNVPADDGPAPVPPTPPAKKAATAPASTAQAAPTKAIDAVTIIAPSGARKLVPAAQLAAAIKAGAKLAP